MSKCTGCETTITEENDGLSLTRSILNKEELERLNLLDKELCVTCKREMLFAGILTLIIKEESIREQTKEVK